MIEMGSLEFPLETQPGDKTTSRMTMPYGKTKLVDNLVLS